MRGKRRWIDYHEFPKPGSLRSVRPNHWQMARSAMPIRPAWPRRAWEIKADPATASRYTARGNLVAVVTNGTAVLGLGNIGALASKPVMEGKAVLFKKFANIDLVFRHRAERTRSGQTRRYRPCAWSRPLARSTLKAIKAPDCFIVEQLCHARMKIPVFHDDQHGTAIVVGAAATNAMVVAGKRFDRSRLCPPAVGRRESPCLRHVAETGR